MRMRAAKPEVSFLSPQIAFLEEKVLSDNAEKNKLSEQNQKLETQCSQMDAIHQVFRSNSHV